MACACMSCFHGLMTLDTVGQMRGLSSKELVLAMSGYSNVLNHDGDSGSTSHIHIGSALDLVVSKANSAIAISALLYMLGKCSWPLTGSLKQLCSWGCEA